MQKRQLLKEMQYETTIKVSGNTIDEAVGKIFQIMRKQVFKEVGKPIIQMEAEEVYFTDVVTDKTTEHFMVFFWPREKVSYTITAQVIVKIKYLDITEEDL